MMFIVYKHDIWLQPTLLLHSSLPWQFMKEHNHEYKHSINTLDECMVYGAIQSWSHTQIHTLENQNKLYQMNEACSCEPDSNEYRAELCQPDAGWCLEDIQVLQDIWHWYEAEGSEETQPCRQTTVLVIWEKDQGKKKQQIHEPCTCTAISHSKQDI